jgi:hypothetical protein
MCSQRNAPVDLEEDVFKLVKFSSMLIIMLANNDLYVYQITSRAAQLRGALKTLSKPYVLQAYNISPQAPKREIRDTIEGLLDEARFIYKVRIPCYFITVASADMLEGS